MDLTWLGEPGLRADDTCVEQRGLSVLALDGDSGRFPHTHSSLPPMGWQVCLH